ncbi:MAG: TonB-dependent receptor [Novosphingobium sp.]
MRKNISRLSLIRLALVAGTALAAPTAALAQAAPDADPDADADAIVVTGFRQSLEAALNLKRESVSAVDAIVAEDIAKFPDQNLAESLQRIPGISIQRDAGEGRAITVRGLSAQFTRVRVNGMETIATGTDGASPNRDRSFDFNVFASELFSSLVVHKTAEASLDEGSLGAVVDLNTGNPLAGKAGLHGALSVTGSYNTLSKNVGPRLAGLLSWRNDEGTFGVSVSAAYSKAHTLELGNNTVRWAQARFDSVNGTPCFTAANAGGTYVPSAACDQAALAFHPRIPRYGEVSHRRERLGLTGSIQWAPSDSTKISIDGLYSRFKEDREEQWGEVLLRTLERPIDVINPVYDGNGNMVKATLNDVYVRTEHYLRKSQTTFHQLGATWDQDVTDKFRFTLMGGFSKSNADIPVETTIAFDDRDAQGYTFDYTDMAHPVLTFGTSVTNPANFQLAEIRDRPSNVTNRFKTVQLRTEWDVTEDFKIKLGGYWRRFNFDTIAFSRDTAVCGNGGNDLVLGTVACSPSSAFGPAAIYGFPVTGALSQLFTLGSAGQPGGTTNEWLVANLPAAAAFTNLYGRAANPDYSNTRGVQETTSGAYWEFGFKGELLGLRYAGNAGVRYARTDQSSYGTLTSAAGNQRVVVERSYDDWLPSMNLAVYPSEDLIIRGAIAKVVTRPTMGNLTPGGTIDAFNFRITFGNPQLQPYRATNFDLGVEWYFAPQALFGVTVFAKQIESFPISQAFTATLGDVGLTRDALPPSSPAYINFNPAQPWTITGNVNGAGATLKGIEIALQLPFKTFASGFLADFGLLANATFIKSKATYTTQGPIAVARVTATGALGPLTSVTRTDTLFGVSPTAFNATLYYEGRKFSGRVMGSYRSRYNDANSGTGNVFEGYGATWNLDASMRYKLNDWIELSVEGNNLLDTYRYRFTDVDANRNYENNHFGRTILFGARLKM